VRLALRFAILLGALALFAPTSASAYPWPIRPFNEQHAVRGYFNDPRRSGLEQAFHFGIDISAPDGTPVYAVTPGHARVRGTSVSVIPSRRGAPRLSYWHVAPAVSSKQHVRKFQLVGHVAPGAGHVHLAEWKNGTYINPLRIGGLAPYVDDTVPRIPQVTFSSFGQASWPFAVRGIVDLTADAFDVSPMPIPAPWEQAILSPSFVRWRVLQGPSTVLHWRNAVNFRRHVLPFSLFDFVYAPGTFQNRPHRQGRYQYYLAHQLDTRALPNGSYTLQVEARDEQHNVGQAGFPFTVSN
jgi:hypothetical protein